MVVGKDDGLSDSCPALSVQFSLGKNRWRKRSSRKQKLTVTAFFLPRSVQSHTVAGSAEWGIKPSQFFWHIWGADLYELSVA